MRPAANATCGNKRWSTFTDMELPMAALTCVLLSPAPCHGTPSGRMPWHINISAMSSLRSRAGNQ
eukprot:8544144-Lingulodinium_polyedra.AAC.1